MYSEHVKFAKLVKLVNYCHLSGTAVLFSLCSYSISYVDAVNTKENVTGATGALLFNVEPEIALK